MRSLKKMAVHGVKALECIILVNLLASFPYYLFFNVSGEVDPGPLERLFRDNKRRHSGISSTGNKRSFTRQVLERCIPWSCNGRKDLHSFGLIDFLPFLPYLMLFYRLLAPAHIR